MEDPTEIKAPPKEESPVTDKVEEAESGPETLRLAVMVEEPTEIKAPSSLANPPTLKVEEADKGAATWSEPATVEEAWAIKPPATVKAKTEVEAAFWISKALRVWPSKVRRARLMELVEVAPTVSTAFAETLLVPTTNWSVKAVAVTMVPESVQPAGVPPASSPHRILPEESVSKAVQVLKVETVKPPVLMITPPEKVEVAVLPIAKVEEDLKTPETWRLPETVEEAEEINPAREESPPIVAVEATDKVLLADKGALTFSEPAIVEEPTEIKAPFKLARLATLKVEEADKGPETFKELEIVEEPFTMRPPRSVNLAASLSSPLFRVEKIRIP